jgi:hypothetical protein
LILRIFYHVAGGSAAVEIPGLTAKLPFSAGNALLALRVICGHDVNQGRNVPMTFVSRLSVVTAYVAFAFVGAIVLGVI